MKFWDSSAVVPLLVEQSQSDEQRKLLRSDKEQIVSWTTHCECFSALARLEREKLLELTAFQQAHQRLLLLAQSWQIVIPEDALLEATKRVLRTHPLRCADALQLASAILASEKSPPSLEFVTLDERLALAASREGFLLVGHAPNSP